LGNPQLLQLPLLPSFLFPWILPTSPYAFRTEPTGKGMLLVVFSHDLGPPVHHPVLCIP
jgi:hypothetical protein